jgi:hypothetical protein
VTDRDGSVRCVPPLQDAAPEYCYSVLSRLEQYAACASAYSGIGLRWQLPGRDIPPAAGRHRRRGRTRPEP